MTARTGYPAGGVTASGLAHRSLFATGGVAVSGLARVMTKYPVGGVVTGGSALRYTWRGLGGFTLGGSAAFDVSLGLKLPISQIQALDAGTLVELYVLDTTMLGGTQYYLSANVNEYGTGVVWKDLQGNTVTYTPFPIAVDGFEKTGKGTQPRPTLTVSNASHAISDLVRQYGDLCGCTVVRRRVMARHLDAANFLAGNANADRTTHYSDDVYFIERRAAETPTMLSFELSNAMDVEGVMLPRRVVQRTLCQWVYQGTDYLTSCPFAGPFSGGNATCAKTLADCKTKFPTGALPFGGFTGARRM